MTEIRFTKYPTVKIIFTYEDDKGSKKYTFLVDKQHLDCCQHFINIFSYPDVVCTEEQPYEYTEDIDPTYVLKFLYKNRESIERMPPWAIKPSVLLIQKWGMNKAMTARFWKALQENTDIVALDPKINTWSKIQKTLVTEIIRQTLEEYGIFSHKQGVTLKNTLENFKYINFVQFLKAIDPRKFFDENISAEKQYEIIVQFCTESKDQCKVCTGVEEYITHEHNQDVNCSYVALLWYVLDQNFSDNILLRNFTKLNIRIKGYDYSHTGESKKRWWMNKYDTVTAKLHRMNNNNKPFGITLKEIMQCICSYRMLWCPVVVKLEYDDQIEIILRSP